MADVPLPYKVHAITTTALGLGLTFLPSTIVKSPPFVRLSRYLNLSSPGTSSSSTELSQADEQSYATIGLLLSAIGLMYMPAFGVRAHANDMLYASVPLRLAVAGLTALQWVLRPKSRDLLKAIIIVEDGIGGMLLGLTLGSFAGRAPAGAL